MIELQGDDIAAGEGDHDARQPHHRILNLEVTGGFLHGTKLEFSDGLNCIIGGRGTGKTTVLEFIRYILGMMPDPPTAGLAPRPSRAMYAAISAAARSTSRSRPSTALGIAPSGPGAMTSRSWTATASRFPVSLDRDLVFKADIYSQNEIEEIATNPRFQLSLIDKFAEEAIRAASVEIQKAKRAIEQSAIDLRHLDQRIREIQDVVPEIEVVGKRLQEMQVVEGADAELINAAHAHKALRTREAEVIADLRSGGRGGRRELQALRRDGRGGLRERHRRRIPRGTERRAVCGNGDGRRGVCRRVPGRRAEGREPLQGAYVAPRRCGAPACRRACPAGAAVSRGHRPLGAGEAAGGGAGEAAAAASRADQGAARARWPGPEAQGPGDQPPPDEHQALRAARPALPAAQGGGRAALRRARRLPSGCPSPRPATGPATRRC